MGKRKHSGKGDWKNIPKISSASKKISAKHLEQLNPEGLPNYMREIKCQTREPLAPIACENESSASLNEEKSPDKKSEDNLSKNNSSSCQESGVVDSSVSLRMTKQPVILDDNIFTFKPKVSTASARLVENLGTDFMTRQQQHLEKQKKLVSISV